MKRRLVYPSPIPTSGREPALLQAEEISDPDEATAQAMASRELLFLVLAQTAQDAESPSDITVFSRGPRSLDGLSRAGPEDSFLHQKAQLILGRLVT